MVKQQVSGYLFTLLNVAGAVLIAVADVFLALFVLVMVLLGLIFLIVLGWMMNEKVRGEYAAIVLSMTKR
jgi:hypothetical protein